MKVLMTWGVSTIAPSPSLTHGASEQVPPLANVKDLARPLHAGIRLAPGFRSRRSSRCGR